MANETVAQSGRSNQEVLLVGVDGGGTKTESRLAVADGPLGLRIVGHGHAGPSNPQAVGLEQAQQHIREAVEAAFADAGREPAPVASACVALAGVGREPIRQSMLQWAQRLPLASQVLVVHDAEAVLGLEAMGADAVALICGTGSFAFGHSRSGAVARSGGWGYLIGDEGSGFALGAEALRAVARATDGRACSTALTDMLLEQLELSQPADLIPRIYNAPAPRDAMAALAPVVFRAAATGDEVASTICRSAAQHLVELVLSVVERLTLVANEFDLALAGAVLVHQQKWAQVVVQSLAEAGAAPRSAVLVPAPVEGALALARRQWQNS